jgi:hypothetical protein
MIGKVTVWQMTEEQRLEYIKKHPIKKIKEKRSSFETFQNDYKWRPEKAVESRMKKNNK